MTFECKKLRDASKGQTCVRCGSFKNVVGCHYTGARRLSYGGGYGQKVHDFLTADLCDDCHVYMDRLSRDKSKKWEHSEEFQHYIILTIERRFVQGVIVVARSPYAMASQTGDRVEVLASSPVHGPTQVHDRTRDVAGDEATVGGLRGEAP